MQLSRRSAVGLVVINALAVATGAAGQVQAPKQSAPSMPSSSGSAIPDATGHLPEPDMTPMTERLHMSAERAHNEDRRKRMLADTEKLLALSTELKAYIEKATKDELSLDVIRKAAEIEKLARDVQQRMKN